MNRPRPLAIVLAPLLVLGAGLLIPATVPGIPAELSADEQVFARHALRETSHLLDHPVQKFLTRRLRVFSVVLEAAEGGCGALPFVSRQRYRGTTQALTLFGIPYETFSVTCEETGIGRG